MVNLEKKLMVSSTPHIRSNDTIDKIMRDVLIALTPAALYGVYIFGLYAALIIAVSVGSCVFFEYAFQKITNQPITISDCSAAVTGLLLAMCLSPTVPIWIPIVGGFFAIVVVKQLFGGLGQNFMNPALASRVFLAVSFASSMAGWIPPKNLTGIDMTTYATPLPMVASGMEITNTDILDAFIGNVGGCIGETSALLLIAGGIYLLYKKVINWRIPVTYIATVFILSYLMGRNGLYDILIGGLMIGAFFMATDYSSSPVTPLGQLIMGIGCGLLTGILRVYASYPEIVSFAILIMNLTVPIIDKYTKPRVFGKGGKA